MAFGLVVAAIGVVAFVLRPPSAAPSVPPSPRSAQPARELVSAGRAD